MWILNHKTLLPAEVPLLESLGFEVFVPSKTPEGSEFASATARYEGSVQLSSASLSKLKEHNFYNEKWTPELVKIINRNFDLIVTSIYETPLTESLRHFQGAIIARVFGREYDYTYTDYFRGLPGSLALIEKAGQRFLLGQAYEHISFIEGPLLQQCAQTIGCGVPDYIWRRRGTWSSTLNHVLFVCPRFNAHPYFRSQYDIIKNHFDSLPHRIIGVQTERSDDKSLLGFISDDDLFRLYAQSRAFLYISTLPRHVHYTPVEAMIIGMPVLYMKRGMLSLLAGSQLAGECTSFEEMRSKAERLLNGDDNLAAAIIERQDRITSAFSDAVVKKQWHSALLRLGLAPSD